MKYICVVDSAYREGNIRLVGGSYNWEGRVEIFYSGMWSSIQDTSWTTSDAKVMCRQLGHSTESKNTLIYLIHNQLYRFTSCILWSQIPT